MDKLIGELPDGMLWVAVALILAQLVVPNLDKLVTVLRREDTVAAITRDVPALIERKKVLSDNGHETLAGVITIYLNGVVTPNALAQLNKESTRAVAKYQPLWFRSLFGIFLLVYLVTVFVYYSVTTGLSPDITTYLESIGFSTALAYITYLAGYTLGFLTINFVYLKLLRKVGKYSERKTGEATRQWKLENGIPVLKANDLAV